VSGWRKRQGSKSGTSINKQEGVSMITTKPLQTNKYSLWTPTTRRQRVIAQRQHASQGSSKNLQEKINSRSIDEKQPIISEPEPDQTLTPQLQKQSVHQASYDVCMQKSMGACFPSPFIPTHVQKKQTFLPDNLPPRLCPPCACQKDFSRKCSQSRLFRQIRGLLSLLCFVSILCGDFACITKDSHDHTPLSLTTKAQPPTAFFKKGRAF